MNGSAESPARLTATVEENVLAQHEHQRTHPTVGSALGRNALNVQGGVYKFEAGQVCGYDPAHGQIDPIEGTAMTVRTSPGTLPPV